MPPFFKAASTSLQLIVYLDTIRPLSEPKWAKTGDVQDWLKSMFGRMFWVAGEAADGWEKKIQMVDPDPVCTSLMVSFFGSDFVPAPDHLDSSRGSGK